MSLLERLARYKGVFANAGIYGGANAVNAAVPYLLLPVVVRYLSPAEYGYYAMFIVMFQLMNAVIGLTTHSAIARAYFDHETHDLPVYIFNCFLIGFGSVVVLAILVAVLPRIFGPAFLPLDQKWTFAALLSGVGQYAILVQLALWQMQSKPLRYGLFQFCSMISLLGLTLLNVVVFRRGWAGCVQAHVATFLVFGGAAFLLLIRGGLVKARVDRASLVHALRYGAPLVPHMLGTWVINMVDRVILLRLMGPAEMGVYSFGYQFGMVLSMIQNSFNQAYVPWLFRKLKEGAPGVRRELVRITYAYHVVILAVAVAIGLLGPLLTRRLGTAAYASAGGVVLWVALAYALNGMYKMVGNYIFYAHKTYLLALTTLAAAGLNVWFTFRWVRAYGAIGAAYATALAFGASFVMVWIASSQVFPMPWFPWSRGAEVADRPDGA